MVPSQLERWERGDGATEGGREGEGEGEGTGGLCLVFGTIRWGF